MTNKRKHSRRPVQLTDLEKSPDLPVGRFQPAQLPELKEESLSPEVVVELQKPAAMISV